MQFLSLQKGVLENRNQLNTDIRKRLNYYKHSID